MGRSLRPAGGGILGLALILIERTGEVEADLQHYYGIPLVDVFNGNVSWRRLMHLVKHLPHDAAVFRVERGPWGLTEQLLAAAVDEARVANWQRAQLHTKEKLKPPKPIERPGVETRHKPKMTDELAARLLARGPQREEVTT